jgi:hypothetical protein
MPMAVADHCLPWR